MHQSQRGRIGAGIGGQLPFAPGSNGGWTPRQGTREAEDRLLSSQSLRSGEVVSGSRSLKIQCSKLLNKRSSFQIFLTNSCSLNYNGFVGHGMLPTPNLSQSEFSGGAAAPARLVPWMLLRVTIRACRVCSAMRPV